MNRRFSWCALIAALSLPTSLIHAAPKLKPPAAFTARAVSATAIQLKWRDTNSAESGYLLEVRKGTGAFKRLAQLPKNSKSFTHRDLVGGTAYSYRLSATLRKKLSPSRTATATTRPGATPPPPARPRISTPASPPGSSATSARARPARPRIGPTPRRSRIPPAPRSR